MEYAKEVLDKYGGGVHRTNRPRQKHFVDFITCAYCHGTGEDPKYGNGSKCPICGATGEIRVKPPVVTCLKCNGSGREGGDLSCLACKGKGMVSVGKDAGVCSKCHGTGEDGIFYCSVCKGQGIA